MNKKVWLLRVGEALPTDEGNQRLLRMGLIAEELVKQGVEVTWWVSSFDHNKKEFRNVKDNPQIVNEKYKLIYLNGNGYKKNWSISRLLHYYKEKKDFFNKAKNEEKPDIILASMPNIDLAQAAVKYGKKHNIPVVVDIRDTWPELYVDYAPQKIKWAIKAMIFPFKRQLSWTLSNATNIYATSDLFLEWGLNYAKRKQKKFDNYYYVSYPDTNIEIVDADLEEWYSMGIEKDDIVLCFFGQFGHAVDIETVLKASLKTVNNKRIKYVICGTGEKLESYKEIVGDNKNVIFPGWVNRKQICALGKISTAGLLSYVPNKNFENSMPNKFCEYLALGLVLLIQPHGMMKKLAEKNNCGFQYNNEQELADILEKICNQEKSAINKMKENSRKLYEKEFRSDVVYKKMATDLIELSKNWK